MGWRALGCCTVQRVKDPACKHDFDKLVKSQRLEAMSPGEKSRSRTVCLVNDHNWRDCSVPLTFHTSNYVQAFLVSVCLPLSLSWPWSSATWQQQCTVCCDTSAGSHLLSGTPTSTTAAPAPLQASSRLSLQQSHCYIPCSPNCSPNCSSTCTSIITSTCTCTCISTSSSISCCVGRLHGQRSTASIATSCFTHSQRVQL